MPDCDGWARSESVEKRILNLGGDPGDYGNGRRQ